MSIQLNDDDCLTLEVQGLIPREILEGVRTLPLNYVLHAKACASAELEGVRSEFARIGLRAFQPIMFRKLKKNQLRRALSELDSDPSLVTVCTLSEILETAFILDMLEKGEKKAYD